ncbi:aldo/keto reductase [Anaerolentibacter hominis]|uniref:aldo/keto reductase n=1 Tax=Anaerolentibacter hominis TaxID=3079009 RepID=UPI0031B822FD
MIYREYKGTEKKVSLMGLGCMRFPLEAGSKTKIDEEKAEKIVDCAYENGVTYFDTAWPYHGGESETFMGKVLKKYPRESYCLVTKMPGWLVEKPEDAAYYFEKQLERLKTDYFDFYLLHDVNRDRWPHYEKNHLYEFCMEMKKQGKIRNLGFSFHDTPEILEQIINEKDWDFVQIQLNYLDWTKQDAKGQYELIRKKGIPCMVMEPVRGGALAGLDEESEKLLKTARPDLSIASWAMRFAASKPNVLTVLSGSSSLEQLQDNLKTMNHFEPYTEAEYALIEEAVKIYTSNVTIPCTGCRYCMDCPAGVDIPKMFAMYNEYKLHKKPGRYQNAYAEVEEEICAHNCVACGQCVEHCPQKIDIPVQMEMLTHLREQLFGSTGN